MTKAAAPNLSSFNSLVAFARRHPYWVLLGSALLFRLATGLLFRQPGYTDAYYYTNVAESLWRGRGFREDYIWNYLSRPLPVSPLNNPSSTYWMPFTSILIYLFYLFTGGTSFLASQLPMMLISAALVPLTYYVVKDIFGPGQGEYYGWRSAGLMIFCGIFAPRFSLPDNFAPFALLTLLALICLYKALRLPPSEGRKARWLMAGAGGCIGLSYLTRVDGVLLLGVTGLVFLLNRYWLRRESALGWGALALMVLAFSVTLLPWLGRSLADTGQLFPGGGTKTLFLREYDDFFSYTKALDLPYYLNQTDPAPTWGIGPLLSSKLDALFQNLYIIWRPTLVFMTPFLVLGLFAKMPERISLNRRGRKGRRENKDKNKTIKELALIPSVSSASSAVQTNESESFIRLALKAEFLPFTVYMVVLYLAMSLLFTFPSPRGSLFHSSGGLLPFQYAAILVGLDRFIEWLGKFSRPKAGAARRRFYNFVLLIASAFMSVALTIGMANDWNTDYNEMQAVGAWLDANAPANTLVMAPDVPAYYYVNHKPAIVITSDPLSVNLELARRYGARYLILQPNHFPTSLGPLLENRAAPGLRLVAQLGEVQIYSIE